MNSAREVGRRGSYSLLGLALQVLSCRVEISQRLPRDACPLATQWMVLPEKVPAA